MLFGEAQESTKSDCSSRLMHHSKLIWSQSSQNMTNDDRPTASPVVCMCYISIQPRWKQAASKKEQVLILICAAAGHVPQSRKVSFCCCCCLRLVNRWKSRQSILITPYKQHSCQKACEMRLSYPNTESCTSSPAKA